MGEFLNGLDVVDRPPGSFHVKVTDIGALIYSIIFHFVDAGCDFFLAYSYFITRDFYYFSWTVASIILPAIIVTFISIRMYLQDIGRRICTTKFGVKRIILCIVGLVLQLALFIRYCDSLYYALKSSRAESKSNKEKQKKNYIKMLNEDSDVAFLRVFECYSESALQLLLQITLLLVDYSYNSTVHLFKQALLIIMGFLSMGLCMATYHRSIRLDQNDKQNISPIGFLIQIFWHMNFTVSRILGIAALASMSPLYACVAVVLHWCGMTVWIATTSNRNFCGNNLIYQIFFSCALGIVYIFNFINVSNGPTRKSYSFFYGFCFIENLAIAIVWGLKSYLSSRDWVYYFFLVIPIFTYLNSMIFFVIYYKLFHPSLKP